MEKYYCIEFEGIDKSGKELVGKYVDILGNHKYVLMDRGLMSNITYSRIFHRDFEYDVEQFRNWIFVCLTCDEEDWKIRCKLTNEPDIDYEYNVAEFNKTREMFEKNNFKVIYINTSHVTPYDAAKYIISSIETLNSIETNVEDSNDKSE